MCCCSCIKKLCVKITYIVLIVLVFGVGLMFSFDTYVSSAVFEKSHYRDANPQNLSAGNMSVTAKTGLFKMPYYDLKYNKQTKCVSNDDSSS